MDPAIPLHRAFYSITSLLYFLLHVGLWANAPAVLAHFPHLYLFWVFLANILAMPTHFIPRASSIHLLLLYLFYSNGLLARSFGLLARSFVLPRPNYHILTSYYFSDLLTFKTTQ